ncbi:MAG: response regulator [bacterium]|nr:response regulator [bacterium]
MSQPKRVLVVEDEQLTRQALADELTNEGFVVLQAGNGEEGLQMALKEHPDLILLDVVMPKLDGISVMSKLREDDWGKDVPIIILTVLDSDDAILEKIVQNKPAYYLIKKNELHAEEIVSKVKEKLGVS